LRTAPGDEIEELPDVARIGFERQPPHAPFPGQMGQPVVNERTQAGTGRAKFVHTPWKVHRLHAAADRLCPTIDRER